MTSIENNTGWFPFQSLYNLISFGSPPEQEVSEQRVEIFKPGEPLSPALREALGIKSRLLPPPWLVNMQRYGPPPSYLDIDICGLNSPLPHISCKYGYHNGGWGYPSVDTFGNPVYGGNPFDEPNVPRKEANMFAAQIQYVVRYFLTRCRFLRKRSSARTIQALGRGYLVRRRYLDVRCWAIVIQAYGRRYLKQLENIITVQSCAKERRKWAEKLPADTDEEEDSLLVEDSVFCQALDASHFCMEDSVLTRLLDNDNYCMEENAFCRVLDAVEEVKEESELSNHGGSPILGHNEKGISTKALKDEDDVVDSGLCAEDSTFTVFDTDFDCIFCSVLDEFEASPKVPGKEPETS